ncbi:MAG: MlaD family protein [Fibromonadaceae bacterium]|nr:MlaD family protein [Fibromonadaceae bacterium]
MHPNSPWHSRDHYHIAFREIGDLRPGDAVNINGLPRGYVVGLELTDSCVWVRAAVLSKVRIPIDSRFNVANAGLMGERVVDILLGDSNDHYPKGTYITGHFDVGGTEMGVLAYELLKETGEVMGMLSEFVDSVTSKEKIAQYKRIGKKANRLGRDLSRMAGSAGNSVDDLIDSLTIAKDSFVEILNNIEADFDKAVNNVDIIKKNFSALEKSLESLKEKIEAIAKELESGSNTISLALSEDRGETLRQEMRKIAKDAEELMAKIRRRGLDLNVDIF